MVGFYSHETMKCCYITVDGILCIQIVIGFVACRMLSHFMYFVRNDENKDVQSINDISLLFTGATGGCQSRYVGYIGSMYEVALIAPSTPIFVGALMVSLTSGDTMSCRHRCHAVRDPKRQFLYEDFGARSRYLRKRVSNCIPHYSVGCNYLSLPEIPASSIKGLISCEG